MLILPIYSGHSESMKPQPLQDVLKDNRPIQSVKSSPKPAINDSGHSDGAAISLVGGCNTPSGYMERPYSVNCIKCGVPSDIWIHLGFEDDKPYKSVNALYNNKWLELVVSNISQQQTIEDDIFYCHECYLLLMMQLK